jgi:hypothetical protein
MANSKWKDRSSIHHLPFTIHPDRVAHLAAAALSSQQALMTKASAREENLR